MQKEENSTENSKVIPEKEVKNTVNQEQVHDLLFGRDLGWQEIIYDLINTEQLDPWDINLTILTEKYLEKIEQMQEMNFFISSKVLLAASLLLRIKSELLLDKYIKSIDEILFGKTEKKKYEIERIELEEDIPLLTPKSPIPRYRKVTLQELIASLGKAIKTENRRIKKEILNKNALRETAVSLPKRQTIGIKDKIRQIYEKVLFHLKLNKRKSIAYSEFVPENREEKILAFFPLLQLEHQKKVWLHQEGHFEEIYIWLKEVYLKHNPDPFAELKEEIKEKIEEMDDEQKKRVEEINSDFENPLGEI
jgi:segregation and condensation protein A